MFTDEDMTAVFHALAHEHRRKILDILKQRPGIGVGELATEFDVTRIAVMNHLAVLEKAGLVISEQDGRTRRLRMNVVPIQMIHERWTDAYEAEFSNIVTNIKRIAEAAVRGKPARRRGD